MRLIWQIITIVGIASALGIGHNAVSENGISLVTPDVARPEAAIQWSLHIDGIRTTLDEAKDAFDQGAVFVDVRTAAEYEVGHIPGARNLRVLGFKRNYPSVLFELPKDTRIVAYCSGGSCQSSTKLSRLLVEEGYTNVGCFFLGWEAWVAAGYPVSTVSEEGE